MCHKRNKSAIKKVLNKTDAHQDIPGEIFISYYCNTKKCDHEKNSVSIFHAQNIMVVA